MSRLSVPELVSAIRESASLTQEGLARELGVSFATVNAWERGRATPRPRYLEVLGNMADGLGISRGLSVLIIDDDAISCTVLEGLLAASSVPADSISASNGSEGLVLCGIHKPDLVLLDIFMPGIDGVEVANRLGQIEGLESTAVVFITASTDPEVHRRILATGRQVLTKPIRQEDLDEILQRLAAEVVVRNTQQANAG